MFKAKKSLATVALVRIILTVALVLLIVLPAYNKIHAALFNSGKKYSESFENFINDINSMNIGRQTFILKLKDKSAIIGFGKNSAGYECFNCYVGVQGRPTIIFNKPQIEACRASACICLCASGFNMVKDNSGTGKPAIEQCQNLNCKKIEQDMADRTTIKSYPGFDVMATRIGGGAEYWKDGFLFANGLSGANGLKIYNDENTRLIVEKRSNVMGFCNPDIMEIHKNQLGFDSCIINEYDEAKKLENTNAEESIKKYQEFIAKYRTGKEVEDAIFFIGKQHFVKGNYKESFLALCQLLKEFPTNNYINEASGMIDEIISKNTEMKAC